MIKELLLSGLIMFSPLKENTEVVEEPNVSTVTPEDKEDIWTQIKEMLDDKDANGRPDIIDTILGKELIGGITIGVIVSLGLYIFSITYTLKKGREFKKLNAKTEEEKIILINNFNKEKENLINDLTNKTNEINKALESTKKLLSEYGSNQISLNSNLTKSINEVNNLKSDINAKISEISVASNKVDKLLRNQKLIANNTPNMVSKGINKQLEEE